MGQNIINAVAGGIDKDGNGNGNANNWTTTPAGEQDMGEHLDSPQAAREAGANVSGRIIVAMTNLPQGIVRESDGSLRLRGRRGNSALYAAVRSIQEDTDWDLTVVAWPGELTVAGRDEAIADHNETPDLTADEQAHVAKLMADANGGARIEPVWLPGPQPRYRQYAEEIVWPTLHYIQPAETSGDSMKGKPWWRDYVTFNEAYRDKILELYQPGDIVWVHDYYLFLLPQMLRMKLPEAHVGLFVHVPFPSSEYLRCIPERRNLLEGMLGANLIATQAESYSRHFMSGCARLLGVETGPSHLQVFGVHVNVVTLPIGIDAGRIEHDAFSPDVDEKVLAIRAMYPDKKIIVGRDRLDSVRGVIQKLHAFEMFLQLYPEWRDRVVLIQVTAPAYFYAPKIEKKVSELVSHINGQYGGIHFSPIHHFPRHIARDEYLALLRVADLGLITSVRDGTNTTSMEYVVCQKDTHNPIILSEFAGTSGSLEDAVLVNPWDAREVAETIDACLRMQDTVPHELAAREKRLYRYVTEHKVQAWVRRYVSMLVNNTLAHKSAHVTPLLDVTKLKDAYTSASQRLFLFDYDGTLTPIVKEPSAAIPSALVIQILTRLCADPKNAVWIISGRDSAFLDKWLAQVPGLAFSAEHGCFLKQRGETEWENLTEKIDMSWQQVVLDIFYSYTERTQGSSVEVKRAALTWHYRRADPDFGRFQAQNLREHLEQAVASKYDVEVMSGKANIEVRPRQFNKGEIVKRIVASYPEQPGCIACFGDDATDEDMFAALKYFDATGSFSVTIGPPSKQTVADWHVQDPSGVLSAISALTVDS